MSELQYWLWLSTAGIGSRARAALLEKYGDAQTAFYAPKGEFKKLTGVSAADAAALERQRLESCSAVQEACQRQGISIISMQDAAYPKRLKCIYSPPAVLYVKGKLPDVDDNVLISIIGTRRASPYGLKMGKKLAFEVSSCGGIVVSLLGRGIDEQTAVGALLAGGACVGVLGTPHECETSRLAMDIAENGGLISEYAPGMLPQRSFFRERNRLASGISLGVTVVEAPEKSGTILFANEALEQGKELFAVPGNADSPCCAGTNSMLKSGAKLVTCGWDVMCEFQGRYPEKIKQASRDCPSTDTGTAPSEQTSAQAVQHKSEAKQSPELLQQLADLTEVQLKIIAAIDSNGSHIDDIVESTALPVTLVLSQLTMLELKGMIGRQAGRRVVLKVSRR